MPIKTIHGVGAVYSLQLAYLNESVKVMKVSGYMNGNATPGAVQYWLMFFEQSTVPNNGTAPAIAPLMINSSNGFVFNNMDLGEGILGPNAIMCLSTTKDTLTIAATTDSMYVDVDVEMFNQPSAVGEITAGDLTTAVDNRAVWSDAAGPNELHKVTVSNDSGSGAYVQVYAKDAPTAGAVPLAARYVPADGAGVYTDFSFNTVPHSNDTDGTLHDGCYLYMSSTETIYTDPSSTDFTIQATFVAR